MEIAERLTVLAEYPKHATAIEQIALLIASTCPTPQDGAWLLKELTLSGRYSKWEGPGWLVQIWQDHDPKSKSLPPEQRPLEILRDVGPLCAQCLSWGWFKTPVGVYERCGICSNSEAVEQRFLDRLNHVAAVPAHDPPESMKRITEEDFAALVTKGDKPQ
jgi:hypothetical protein